MHSNISDRIAVYFRFSTIYLFLAIAIIDQTSPYSSKEDDEHEFIRQHGVLPAAGGLFGSDLWSVSGDIGR